MAGEVFQNRKRKSRGENIQNNDNESAKRSKQYTTQNQDEKQFLTPEKHASGPHNTDSLNLTVRSLIFHRTTSQPPLPGTPCQFVQTSSGSSILGTERMESKTNVAINNFTTEKRMSPDSGITNTPTNTTSSPDLSLAHAHSSGIGSLQAMECNDEDMQLVNSQTSDEVDYIKMKMENRNITSSIKQKRMQKFLQRKFVYLKNELIPSGIVDRLLSDQVITDQDNDDICRVESRGQKCEFLIKAINRSLENSDACAVQKIEAAFSKEGYYYVFKDYKEYSMSGKRKSPPGSSSLWKEKLKSFEPKLEDDLDPRFFIDQLVSEEVLEFDEHQNISDVTFKPEKINCLIKYLHRKTEQTFNDFCKVLKKAYSKNTFVDKLCSSHEIEELKEPDANPQVSLVSREEQDCRMTPSATAHITFRFDGEAKDIEQMIVDDNNPTPNESLQEEVMDIGAYEIVKTTFSSIRIVLSALSHSSEMQIVKKCKQSPVFLMKLLQNLIKPEHLKMLEERGIKRIFFEIKVKLPGSEHISKTDIVRNKDLLCNELNKVEILQFLGETDITDHVKAIEDIKKAETNTQCVMKFVEFIVSEGNETYLEAFLEFLKKHNKDELITQLSRLQSCSCKISKKNIVEHYSLIEKELTDVDTIIKAFSEYADFPADLKDKFKSVLNSSHPEVKVDTFLRHLLALPDDGIQLCLLEERLHATDQVALLDKITKMSEKNEGIQVTDDDIRRNRLYLCDELEPKQYREMVKEIDETDNLSEQILEATSRESRCEVLLDFISKACKTDSKAHILSKFSQSLLKWNAGVLQYIKKTRKPVQEGKRQMEIENIIASYKHIVDEIEPLSLIRFFEEREELTEDEIRCIRRSSSRRARAVTFLNFVLKGTESKVSCLIDYLRFAGYNSLLKKMRECIKKYKECPRLYAFDLKDCYVLKGDLDINFNNEKNTQEQEHSNVPTFDNWSLVTNWVLENFFSQKREFEEQKTQEIREDTQRLQDEAKCSTSYENVLCIPDVQNEKKESTQSALQYNERETKIMEICANGERIGIENKIHESSRDKLFHVRSPKVRHSSNLLTAGSPRSSHEYIRNHDSYDRNSASCSPSSIRSLISRATSIEDDSNILKEEQIDGDEALHLFAEGNV
ncbi:uncharacterized protein LOC132754365 [Ruditapes philippinarum]|uniref:uncharacterized protein LOC132754365 n=1 Tax=Ruditapes philippinarum TaxID=129788 RepID=UPI00295AF07C|nr:uncharacterized protein LOC132754365 [Ruditapes philippinarum]XP_060600970.1 uncharacterized protein LOC132754365 [Ruditapes philippinarum]XP_060600978.1 uncharacterized protein LOC132754365 [Ruditapes philippinarum]XP_060600985.1 uncharacterized protein LOC132754365 [Ruditapes philippinarum]XP_060600992.1 uncharacterized protein LOC132754365 [Ruditapes philippinarum]